MADDNSDDGIKVSVQMDAAALHAALSASGASEEAREYLRKQSRIADIQIDTLQKQDEFETSHLRWRRLGDQMRGAGQMMLAAIGALFVFAIAAAVWSAAHDDALVIEAFNVPPDMVQRGLTGDVVSSLLLDRLTFLQASTDSLRAPSTYAGGASNDIKVLIPNTGISISEAYRYLAGWLGHQTHISGEIYRTAKGIVLVVRTSGKPATSFEGSDTQLNTLMAKGAEAVFGQTQPYRYAVYLLGHGRNPEADGVLRQLALNGPASERPWAYALWMYTTTDIPTGISRAHTAVKLAPGNLLAQMNTAQAEAFAGHDEQVLSYSLAAKAAFTGGDRRQIREDGALAMAVVADLTVAEEKGDFAEAIAQGQVQQDMPDFNGSLWSGKYTMATDAAAMHDFAASHRYLDAYTDAELFHRATLGQGWNQTNFDFPQFRQLAARDDWAAARSDIFGAASATDATAPQSRASLHMVAWPLMALAEAKTGDVAAAWKLIAKTPLDCYLCLRVRGQIAQTARDWAGAASWFGRAAKLAPSIPFAHTDWGAMLMAKGDTKGAITKFTVAHQKGPHFADPLEMWGEALLLQNRSDLALAKFEEAARYAPNWGRLHLKWGEALWFAGHKDEAAQQRALARHLYLTPSERVELNRLGRSHG
jgi:tetratricopeptide (TPR) repeat protein